MKPNTPYVGLGVTYGIGSDCYPATIISITNKDKKIVIQFDFYTPTEGYDYFKNQVYTFTPNPFGRTQTWTLRKNGHWVPLNSAKAVGYLSFKGRRAYSDPSF